jgi:hypothetical protein
MSRGLLLAAGGLTAPLWFTWLSEQMARLQPRKYVQLALPESGLRPIPGQPGMFMDAATGQVIGMRDFTEDDKYDTIYIPSYANGKPAGHHELRIAPKGLM